MKKTSWRASSPRAPGNQGAWLLGLFLPFLYIPGPLQALQPSGASFLKIGVGARPSAMGEAYVASAADINGLYYNPAGLGRIQGRVLGFTHAQWLGESRFDFIGLAMPTRFGAVGMGLTRLASGSLDARSSNRQASGSFESVDSAYTVGLSRPLDRSTSLGANVKFIESRIGAYSSNTLALDFGMIHSLDSRPLSVGVAVSNMGKGMSFLQQSDALPLSAAAGISYRLAGTLQLAVDVAHGVKDKKTDLRLGTEYSLMPSVMLRAGSAAPMAKTDSNGGALWEGLGAGLGLRLGRFNVDYTFSPYAALGNVQRVSLGAKF